MMLLKSMMEEISTSETSTLESYLELSKAKEKKKILLRVIQR